MNGISKRVDKENFNKKIGAFIRKKRLEQNMSGAELARRIFMEKSNLYKLEKGGYSPTLHILAKISEALRMNLQEFLADFEY